MITAGSGRALLVLVSFLVVGLFGLTYMSYQLDIRQARLLISSGSHIAQTPRGSIEYAEAGNGPPLLVVHGAGGGYDQGLEFGEPLARHGFRVIAMSRFGYLGTPCQLTPRLLHRQMRMPACSTLSASNVR